MEKKKVVLLSACIEKNGFGLFCYSETQKLFEYHTTRLVENSLRQRGMKVSSIIVDDLSSDEMMDFLNFMDKTKALNSIGINDSSAIYWALKNNIPIFVNDDITIRVCSTLGISFITEQRIKEERNGSGAERVLDIQDKKISINHEVVNSDVSMILDKSLSFKNIRL